MTRRIIFIVGGALLILALMFVVWFWLFGKQTQVENQLGQFGTAEDRTGGSVGTGTDGNTQVLIGGTTDTSGTGGSTNVQTPLYISPGYTPPADEGPIIPPEGNGIIEIPDVPTGVSWLDGSTGGGTSGGGSSVAFTPTPINEVNNVNIEGTAFFSSGSSGGSGGSGGVGLGSSLLGAAGGCLANYAVQKGLAAGSALVGGIVSAGFGAVRTTDMETHAGLTANALVECVVRALARIAIQQLTAQTVAWINSGFDGKPAFVQDFNKFFNDVADQAAGDLIQGSGLSFLCSPFQLQVRIAIAQSYARRTSGFAQSCTLTDVVGNVENFMNGNFSEGGWPGLIAFTTVPTNNPFGAYAGAQVMLNNRVLAATTDAERRISPGGFLSRQECDEVLVEGFDGQTTTQKTNCRIITPGSTFEAALTSKFGAEVQGLQVAQSIDEILNALFNSLTTNIFQKGLANLSSSDLGGQVTSQDTQAVIEAQGLLTDLRTAVQRAQQYASVQAGSISDIQNAQSNLSTLQNCWLDKNDSSKADDAAAQISALEARVTTYNNAITQTNAALAQIQQIQTQALAATDVNDVYAAEAALTQAENSGALITDTDIVSAQQNRTTLQSEMAAINQQTSAELTQCYAS